MIQRFNVFQSYGLAERLLREGNQIHMSVRPGPNCTSCTFTQTGHTPQAFYNPNPNGGIEASIQRPRVSESILTLLALLSCP